MLRTVNSPISASEVSLFGVGAMMLIAGTLLWLQFPRQQQAFSNPANQLCSANSDAGVIPQGTLEQLPEHYGISAEEIQNLLGEPLCDLPRLAIRADVLTERSIYALEDGQQIVVAYEEGNFVGHSLEQDQIPQELVVQQAWDIQPGDTVAGYPVVASLGELSIQMRGRLHAPDLGQVATNLTLVSRNSTKPLPQDCVVFSSPQLPTYLSQLCGVRQTIAGGVAAGQAIAQVRDVLHFSLLTLRPTSEHSSEWQYVEPAPGLLAEFLGA